MKTAVFFLKDKQFFKREDGRIKLAGNPIAVAKELRESGVRLLHIEDADIRTVGNFDVYDKLTYIINIEVEAPCDERIIKKLLELRARVVVDLPCAKLEKFKESKKLLVGKIKRWGDIEGINAVNDVIVFREEDIEKAENLGKRVIFWGKTKKKVFCQII